MTWSVKKTLPELNKDVQESRGCMAQHALLHPTNVAHVSKDSNHVRLVERAVT